MRKGEQTSQLCPHCGVAMKYVRSIPALGGLPEIEIFYCAPCSHVETIKLKRAA
jgi:hypothetical protein